MEIDNKNFQKEKQNIIQNIRKSSFIAFDFEFTGLTTDYPYCRQTEFQDEVEHYERVKQICVNFCILQFGITCFEYKDGVYQTYCYNIYTRNPPKGKNKRNLFICDTDSLEFLSLNEMDFKKVFLNGVSSRRLSEREQAIQEITQRMTEKKVFDYEFLSPKDQIVFRQVEERLMKLFQQGKEGVVDFHSKTILSYIQKKYFIAIGDKSKKPDLKQFEHIVKPPKGNKIPFKPQQDAEKFIDKARLEELLHEEMGLSELVEQMIKCKVPLVGHFNHLDLGFLYHWYIAELPPTYQEYEVVLTKSFPYIYDSKVISRSIQKQIKGLKVDLESLSQACLNPHLLASYNNVLPPKINKYQEGKCAHEAGYDSYITGLVFAAMSNFLLSVVKTENKGKNKKGKQQKEQLEEYNPKQTPKYPEFDYKTYPKNLVTYSKCTGQILMGTEEISHKFDHVIVIQSTFKNQDKEFRTVCDILKEYGSMKVSIRDKTYIEYVEKQDIEAIIKQNPKLNLVPYRQRKLYKSTQYI